MNDRQQRHGRRGWLILLTLMSCQGLVAQSQTVQASLVWEDVFFTDEQAILDGTSVVASTGTTVTFSRNEFSDNDGGSFDLTTGDNTDFVTFEGDQMGKHHGFAALSFDNENNDPVDYVEFSLNFDRAITDLQFSLLDVDGNNSFDDAVEIYYNGSNNARDNSSIVAQNGAYNIPDEHAYMHGWEGDGKNAGNGQTHGNIDFDFGSLNITTLTIRFFSTTDARSNPIAQQIGLSDLTFVEAVPEASSLAYMSVFGALVLAFRHCRNRRRRKRRHAPPVAELRLITRDDIDRQPSETPPDVAADPSERWILPFPNVGSRERHRQAA